jgi:hypothetical protein
MCSKSLCSLCPFWARWAKKNLPLLQLSLFWKITLKCYNCSCCISHKPLLRGHLSWKTIYKFTKGMVPLDQRNQNSYQAPFQQSGSVTVILLMCLDLSLSYSLCVWICHCHTPYVSGSVTVILLNRSRHIRSMTVTDPDT